MTKAFSAASLVAILAMSGFCFAAGPGIAGAGPSKIEPGQSGVAWFTTWKTGEAEAKRSGRPILFMAAATQCSGVSGVF